MKNYTNKLSLNGSKKKNEHETRLREKRKDQSIFPDDKQNKT